MPPRTGNWCYKCGAQDTQPAGKDCSNPSWHAGYVEQAHFQLACESGAHCQCYEDGMRCCTCRDRKL